jgi:hypothetical protein
MRGGSAVNGVRTISSPPHGYAGTSDDEAGSARSADRCHPSAGTTHRNPTWLVDVSTGSG